MNQKTAPVRTLKSLRDEAMNRHRAGETDEARKLYEEYLLRVPGDSGVWSNLGALHRSEGRHVLARAAQRRAYAIEPDSEVIQGNLANILTDLGNYEEALELRAKLLKSRPDDQGNKAMIGKALRAMGRYDEGIAHLEKAIEEHPDYAEMRIQLALTQLAKGDYANGFDNYAARWDTGELTRREIDKPEWDLKSPLDGKRILVVPEQGFGDTITFARFIPELRRFNPARVMMVTERPMQRILSKVKGVDWSGLSLPEGEDYDTYVHMMDLPRLAFHRDPEVPAPTRLFVPQDSRDRAKEILRPFDKTLNVGLVWCGSLTYRGNAFRSFSHRDYYPLLEVPGVSYFNLYKGPRADNMVADGAGSAFFDVARSERDFGDSAAMMQGLDLVITSCTVTAHLAGSLGVRTWVLLHWDAFWLWEVSREDSPWYPNVRLFRQDKPMDWAGVIDRVKTALAEESAKRSDANG